MLTATTGGSCGTRTATMLVIARRETGGEIDRREIVEELEAAVVSVGGPSPRASTTSPSPLGRARAPAAGRPAGAASGMARLHHQTMLSGQPSPPSLVSLTPV